jgi:hypothetical protein
MDPDTDQSERSPSSRRPITISGEDARGGEIILRTRRRRMIFIGGLIGLVLLVVIIRFAEFT